TRVRLNSETGFPPPRKPVRNSAGCSEIAFISSQTGSKSRGNQRLSRAVSDFFCTQRGHLRTPACPCCTKNLSAKLNESKPKHASYELLTGRSESRYFSCFRPFYRTRCLTTWSKNWWRYARRQRPLRSSARASESRHTYAHGATGTPSRLPSTVR